MRKRRLGSGIAIVIGLLGSGPGVLAASSPCENHGVQTFEFLGRKRVIEPDAYNCKYAPTGSPAGYPHDRLLVYFPGGDIGDATRFLERAAGKGYHVIGLHAPLTFPGFDNVCGENTDCYGQLLKQMVEGNLTGASEFFWQKYPDQDYPHVENSLNNRLVKLLMHLRWKQFLDASGSTPRWSKIVVSGQSKGATVALWMLKHYQGTGMKAILFSGPSGYRSNMGFEQGITSKTYSRSGFGVVAAPSYIPTDPPWKEDVYILCNSHDKRWAPNHGNCAVGSHVKSEDDPCWSGSSYRSVGQLLGKVPRRFDSCSNLPIGRFLVDTSAPDPPGDGHHATITNAQATPAAKCAWDHFLRLY